MRIAPIIPGSDPALAAQEQRILAARGRVSPLYQVLLNSPAIAHGWEQMLSAIRLHSGLPADLRELVILRVAVLNGADYEFQAHVPHAQAAGLTAAAIATVHDTACADDPAWTAAQRLVLRLTDAMTRDIAVDDALHAQIARQFDARAQVELLATVAAYNMVSRFLVAAAIGGEPASPSVPDSP